MLPGTWKDATIAVGSTESTAVDLGRSYDWVNIQVPGLHPSAFLNLKTCEVLGGTYRELDTEILADVGNGNCHQSFEIGNWQYVKIKLSVSQTESKTFRIRGNAT